MIAYNIPKSLKRRHIMKKLRPIAVITVLAFIVSCGGKNYFEAIKAPEKKFYQGKFKDAARMLLPQVNKSSKDQLLFQMECGYMLHAGGDYDNSNKVLLKAAKIAKIIPTSVSKQVKSLLTNEGSSNYKGEDFEKVLIHMYLGINFLKLKKYDSARVEFKLVNEELSRIRYEGKARYKQNLMAKYLTAVAYEIVGEENNDMDDIEYAYKEYEQIHKLAPGLSLVYADLQRVARRLKYMDDYGKWSRKFGRRNLGSPDAGEVILIFQSGKGAVKKSRGKLLSDRGMNAAIHVSINSTRMKQGVTAAAILIALKTAENPIPRFQKRSDRVKNVRMLINNRVYNTYMMEDIASTAVQNLKDDYNRLRKKVAGSIVVKAVASLAASIAAKEIAKKAGAGAFSGLIGTIAGAGTGAALFSQMKPDLRCWHTLPAKLHLARAFVEPGKHDVTLEFIGHNGTILDKTTRQFTVEKGKKNFLNIRSLY